MNKGFQYNMATGITTLPAAVIVSLVILGIQFHDKYLPIAIAVCLLSAYLLAGLNSTFGIIRTRSYLASAMLMFMYSSCGFVLNYQPPVASIIPLLFIGILFFVIKGYESRAPQVDVFNMFLCASIGCIADKNLFVAIPLFFICMTQLKSMSVRGILAAILGFAAPFWIITGYFIITGSTEDLKTLIGTLFCFNPFNYNHTNIMQWICIAAMFIIFLSSAVPAARISLNDKVKNRSIIKSIYTTGSYLFMVIILLPETGISFLPLIMIATSILFGYVMTQLYNKLTLAISLLSLLIISSISIYGLLQ